MSEIPSFLAEAAEAATKLGRFASFGKVAVPFMGAVTAAYVASKTTADAHEAYEHGELSATQLAAVAGAQLASVPAGAMGFLGTEIGDNQFNDGLAAIGVPKRFHTRTMLNYDPPDNSHDPLLHAFETLPETTKDPRLTGIAEAHRAVLAAEKAVKGVNHLDPAAIRAARQAETGAQETFNASYEQLAKTAGSSGAAQQWIDQEANLQRAVQQAKTSSPSAPANRDPEGEPSPIVPTATPPSRSFPVAAR